MLLARPDLFGRRLARVVDRAKGHVILRGKKTFPSVGQRDLRFGAGFGRDQSPGTGDGVKPLGRQEQVLGVAVLCKGFVHAAPARPFLQIVGVQLIDAEELGRLRRGRLPENSPSVTHFPETGAVPSNKRVRLLVGVLESGVDRPTQEHVAIAQLVGLGKQVGPGKILQFVEPFIAGHGGQYGAVQAAPANFVGPHRGGTAQVASAVEIGVAKAKARQQLWQLRMQIVMVGRIGEPGHVVPKTLRMIWVP